MYTHQPNASVPPGIMGFFACFGKARLSLTRLLLKVSSSTKFELGDGKIKGY
jgi:hypothetical protein